MAVTPFQLTEPFSTDSFNSRIGEINTMFGGLGNEYVWEKGKYETVSLYDEIQKLGSVDGVYLSQGSSSSYTETVYFSGSYTVSGSTVTLDNPSSVTVGYNYLSNAEQLKGKYFINGAKSGTSVRFLPSEAVLSQFSYAPASTYALKADLFYEYSNFREEEKFVSYGYVNSPDPNAYPPVVPDGYTYTPLGQLGAKMQIVTGSYIGTGTFGSDNPTILTADFEIKLVIVQRQKQTTNNTYCRVIAIPGMTQANNGGSANNDDYVATVDFSFNRFSMYSTNASGQMNASSATYVYTIIG